MSAATSSLALALLAVGCATGGKPGGDQPVDAAPKVDGSPIIDAPRLTDGPTSVDAAIDAQTQMTPDAGPGGVCSNNAACTFPGECCFSLGGGAGLCTPGTVIGSTCLPQ